MRHRIKKIPTLSTLLRFRKDNEHKLLHSDKSTHFYNKLSYFSSKNGINPQLVDEDSVNPTSPSHETRRSSGLSLQAEAASSSGRYPADGFLGKARLGLTSTLLVIPAFAFLLVLGMMVCSLGIVMGIGSESAYAEAITTNPADYASISFSLSNNNGEELSQGEVVSTEATAGLVSYISNRINITTKNIERFYVTVQATSDGTSNLVGTEHKATIAPVGNNTTVSNFSDNTWGYAVSTTNMADSSLTYNPLPTYSESTTPQYSSSSNLVDGNHNLKLVFAAKINANKPADHYTTKAMVSVVADAKTITLSDITYMQEMTPNICSNSVIGESKSLIDGRDTSTSYTVKKLSDNNCWMTDNLRIVDKVITSDDSNVTSNFTIPASTDPWSDTNAETNKVHYAGNTIHGAYYTWYTATAGTGTSSVQSGQASGSICPKGWRLPTGGDDGEFQALYSLGSAKVGSFENDGNNTSGWWLGGTANAADAAFFTASGNVHSSLLGSVGSGGFYWSSTPYGSGNPDLTYNLGFGIGGVYPAGNSSRLVGSSVRCVVR